MWVCECNMTCALQGRRRTWQCVYNLILKYFMTSNKFLYLKCHFTLLSSLYRIACIGSSILVFQATKTTTCIYTSNTNILWQIFCSCIKNFTNVFLYYSILLLCCLSDPSAFVSTNYKSKELWYGMAFVVAIGKCFVLSFVWHQLLFKF